MEPLLPLRHSRMSVSPFTFYRGSAVIMASDLAAMPNSGLITQLCGDAHLSNFGMFAAPDRNVVFDINDFDETNPGPFEWDVLRLATSFVLAGRDKKPRRGVRAQRCDSGGLRLPHPDGGLRADARPRRLVRPGQRRGARAVGQGDRAPEGRRRRIQQSVAKARSRDAWSAISKMTEIVDGQRQFRNQPPVLMRVPTGRGGLGRSSRTCSTSTRRRCPRDRQQLLRRYHPIDFGPQGRRRGQRRPARLRGAAAGTGRERPHRPPGQAGRAERARAASPSPRSFARVRGARRRRPAVHAGRLGRLPRLDPRAAAGGTSTCGSCAT